MEMKKINSGKLRAIGYDARARMLQVQLDNGNTLHTAVSAKKLGAVSAAQGSMELLSRKHQGGVRREACFRQRPPPTRTRSTNCSRNPKSKKRRFEIILTGMARGIIGDRPRFLIN